MIDWQQRAARLAENLAEDGVLTDPRWMEALRVTPRHPFVPLFYEQRPGANAWDTVTESSDAQRWAEAVYSDTTLVTAVRSYEEVFGGFPVPISSSTTPSLMMRMLELLDVADTHRVLEIGTGTGYNAALLCHRVGATRVTTVELHPDLAETARHRLAALGLHPTVVHGDGTAGSPHGAPYDRIIATCGAPRIPGSWVSQLGEAGRIVVDLRSESSSGLVVLDRAGPGHVSGRFTGRPGYFMWLRPEADHPLPNPRLGGPFPARDGRSTVRDVAVHPDVLDRPGLRTLVGITLPDVEMGMPLPRVRTIHAADGSWAKLDDDGAVVTQGGPRRLWDRIETYAELWWQLGSPDTDRYGVTVSTAGRHVYWLDDPSALLPENVQPRRRSSQVGLTSAPGVGPVT